VSPATISARSPGGRLVAEFLPEANMLCASLRHDGAQLLAQREGATAYANHGKTMGIPLLFPWANRLGANHYSAAGKSVTLPEDSESLLRDPQGLPIHGLLPRLLRWAPEAAQTNAEVKARLRWDQAAEHFGLFPYTHDLHYHAQLSDTSLTISITIAATGGDPVPVSLGFHPYLRPGGGERKSWQLHLPDCDRLLLDKRLLPTGRSVPALPNRFALSKRSLDEGFTGFRLPARFAVESPERHLAIELLEGYRYAQIYAPLGERFICFKPMSAPTDALRSGALPILIKPGGSQRAIFRLSLQR
jgi:aldose 1-epimerase